MGFVAGSYAFPTAVGMNRHGALRRELFGGVPHSRGDEPIMPGLFQSNRPRSPQPWG